MKSIKTTGLVLAVLILLIGTAVYWAYGNLSDVTRHIVEKEIPNLTFEKLEVGWNEVALTGVKYTSPTGKVLLKSESIRVSPSLESLFSDAFRISLIEIAKPYVFIERRSDGEVLLPIPQPAGGEPEQAPSAQSPAQPPAEPFVVKVDQIVIREGSGEFVDESVGKPFAAYKIGELNLRIADIVYPQEAGRIPVEMSLTVEGPREGKLRNSGWVDPVGREAQLHLELDQLFIPHAEPYYRSADTTARLADGTLDLRLDLKMQGDRVVLPGEVTMGNLRFAGEKGKFFGVPVAAVARYFEEEHAPITIPFEVEGSVDRPDEIRVKVISIVVKRMLAKLGTREVEKVTDRLKEGDVEGAKEEVKNLEKRLKGLFR
jgi:hypothetical protein